MSLVKACRMSCHRVRRVQGFAGWLAHSANRILNWPDHLSNSGQPSKPRDHTRIAVPLQSIEPKRLYRQIADQLRALIAKGEFVPGARLPAERDLARQLGVSRPSVREALIALEVEGWVEVRNDGTKGHVIAAATYVIDNDGPREALAPQVDELWRALLAVADATMR